VRLTDHEAHVIVRTARQVFPDLISIKLFGSRTDDMKKGGDIDLLIVVPEGVLTVAKSQKFKFVYDLQGLIGERRIDVVIASPFQMDTDEFLLSLESLDLSN